VLSTREIKKARRRGVGSESSAAAVKTTAVILLFVNCTFFNIATVSVYVINIVIIIMIVMGKQQKMFALKLIRNHGTDVRNPYLVLMQ